MQWTATALLLSAVLHLAVASAAAAQERPLSPRLTQPALWSPFNVVTSTEPEAPQMLAEERRPYAAMAGASTLGSAIGAGAGLLIGVGATDSMVGLLAAYPGAWIGAAIGADLTGAPRVRSFVASTVGLAAGAAVMAWGGESWGWVGFGVHGLLTSLLAGGAERPEAASGS